MSRTTSKKLFFSVTLCRALAACLITNAHYSGVYPVEMIASGGLLGDVLFFGVSGFCLCSIKKSFVPWYLKRLYRCYLPTLLITAIYLLIGFYSLEHHNAFWWLVFPTAYHFIASIILLYIPYYIVMSVRVFREHLPAVMAVVGAAAVIVYLVFYDKSYYHIDNVREPYIEFLFFESMLIGAYFYQKKERFLDKKHPMLFLLPVIFFALYFSCKTFFSHYERFMSFQIVNQLVLTGFLYTVFRLLIGLDGSLEKLPRSVKKTISYLAEITLEIYVVQYAIIPRLAQTAVFPLNWLLITAAILISATALHYVCKGIVAGVGSIGRMLKGKTKEGK